MITPFFLLNSHKTSCISKDLRTKTIILQVTSSSGLFSIYLSKSPSSPQAFVGIRSSADVWRARLGHPSNDITLDLIRSHNLPCTTNKLCLCHDCCVTKAHRLPFSSSSSSISSSPLHVVHTDIWGPSLIVSSNGFRYYLLFVDDYSKFT
jgi:GAG-pre-integrase domain